MTECRGHWVGPLFQLNSQTEPVMMCRADSNGKLGHQNIMLQIEIFIFWHTYRNHLDAMGCRVTFIQFCYWFLFYINWIKILIDKLSIVCCLREQKGSFLMWWKVRGLRPKTWTGKGCTFLQQSSIKSRKPYYSKGYNKGCSSLRSQASIQESSLHLILNSWFSRGLGIECQFTKSFEWYCVYYYFRV